MDRMDKILHKAVDNMIKNHHNKMMSKKCNWVAVMLFYMAIIENKLE